MLTSGSTPSYSCWVCHMLPLGLAQQGSFPLQEVCENRIPGMHPNDKPVCQSPLLRNPLQVERHQGPGCGGCIFLFIIDDPDPDRQHATHVIWIHFGFRCMPSSGLDSEPSLCAEGGEPQRRSCMCERAPARAFDI